MPFYPLIQFCLAVHAILYFPYLRRIFEVRIRYRRPKSAGFGGCGAPVMGHPALLAARTVRPLIPAAVASGAIGSGWDWQNNQPKQ